MWIEMGEECSTHGIERCNHRICCIFRLSDLSSLGFIFLSSGRVFSPSDWATTNSFCILSSSLYCHDFGVWLWTGFGLVNWIYWTLVHTTLNYKHLQRYRWSPHFTNHYTLCHFPACCSSNSRSVGTAFNSGDSSASLGHVVTVRRISHNWTHSAGLGSSLYSLGADPTENSASNSCYVLVMVGFLAIDRISLTCSPAVTQQRMFLVVIVA
jgi:hypothetical protein